MHAMSGGTQMLLFRHTKKVMMLIEGSIEAVKAYNRGKKSFSLIPDRNRVTRLALQQRPDTMLEWAFTLVY